MISPSTYDLVKSLKKGNISSFDTLFQQYYKKVYLFAKGIVKSHEEAEHIVLEVFIKIWEKHEELDENKSFESYIFTISYNTSISLLRKKLSEKSILEKWYKKHQNDIQVINEAEYNDLHDRAKRFIDQLSPRRRQIFRMSREEGLSYKEISRKLGISVNTVENHMVACLKFLRLQLEET